MSVEARQYYVVLFGKHLDLHSGAQIRKNAGNIGQFQCGEDDITVYSMTGVWSAKYPEAGRACGAEVFKNSMYDVVAPGCEDRSAIMIDDWTYMTRIDFP